MYKIFIPTHCFLYVGTMLRTQLGVAYTLLLCHWRDRYTFKLVELHLNNVRSDRETGLIIPRNEGSVRGYLY